MYEFTRLYFVEYRHVFDGIRLFSYILFILRLQFSAKDLAPNGPNFLQARLGINLIQ